MKFLVDLDQIPNDFHMREQNYSLVEVDPSIYGTDSSDDKIKALALKYPEALHQFYLKYPNLKKIRLESATGQTSRGESGVPDPVRGELSTTDSYLTVTPAASSLTTQGDSVTASNHAVPRQSASSLPIRGDFTVSSAMSSLIMQSDSATAAFFVG